VVFDYSPVCHSRPSPCHPALGAGSSIQESHHQKNMKINFLTIFPQIFDSYLNESILKRAQAKKLVSFNIVNIRDFTTDKHRKVDDVPYGGGAGMVMKVEPIYKALQSPTVIASPRTRGRGNPIKNRTILLSAKGKIFIQKDAARLAKYNSLTFICGHYEGVDERVKKFVDEEISIGEYVLTGGELPAMVIADAVTRLLPGVIKKESLIEESYGFFSPPAQGGVRGGGRGKKSEVGVTNYKEYPHYTRPEIFEYRENGKKKKLAVPAILLSGDHKKIKEWREKSSK
jgi:tRNA (guanine37-N1)-methyltransferase